MDFSPEFLIPNLREREAIRHYFQIESDFMPTKDFFAISANIRIRKLAVSVIATHWTGSNMDEFVPYLAMNYFDRFASRNPVLDVELCLVAICCLTIAAKMRTKSFSLSCFLEGRLVAFTHETIMRMELRILNGLEWRMRPVTPFCFLDYYYPTFKKIGGFKRRSINEIIVQAQGEDDFTEYKPSQIAYSSFLAATDFVYPLRATSIEKPEGLTSCYRGLVYLCISKDIKIECAKSETASSWSETKTETESNKERQARGKMWVVSEIEEEDTKHPVSISDIAPAQEAAPKRLMNFDLMWPIDVFASSTTYPESLHDLEVPQEGGASSVSCSTINTTDH